MLTSTVNGRVSIREGGLATNILVASGAGYIGSHMAKLLRLAGYHPVVIDDLSQGRREAVTCGQLIVGDVADADLLNAVSESWSIAAVMHFASFIQVGESVKRPDIYYQNNLVATLNLLDAMRAAGVRNFIFSSTAAIFGDPAYTPIDESHPKQPINPYGRSKWMVEQVLEDYDRAYGMKSICLRYFNAAGADPDGELGERHEPETHLIPLLLQVASGRRDHISVFGADYPTPDGTCIRDYIHVSDLCDARLLALDYLMRNNRSERFNLGNGSGYSVNEVISAVEKVTGKSIARKIEARREGDPPVLVADSTRAKSELEWKPRFGDLETIIRHAWQWELKHFGNISKQST